MQYFGGKARTYKDILKIIKQYRKDGQTFFSPFVGGGWVEQLIGGKKILNDSHYYLIEMYKELQKGWRPPPELSKEEYDYIKTHKDEKSYLTGFVGFGCCYSGKWFQGYAKNKNGRNYCLNAKNSLQKKIDNGLLNATFYNKDYKEFNPKDMIIYCDSPYQDTACYQKAGKFNTNEFWEIMRVWSKDNIVLISEYKAPDDFIEIWRKEVKTDIRNKDDKRLDRIEKLFICKNNLKQEF